MDVSDGAAVHSFVQSAHRRFGRIDVCVTNAGGPPPGNFLQLSLAEWEQAVKLTLLSAVHFAREVLPLMQQRRWGRFITVTSISVKQPVDGLILSNSLRAAVAGLAKSLANEFGADGITVNNVCPGYTLTNRLEQLAAHSSSGQPASVEATFAKWSAEVPLRRLARPEEFAAVVAFLASERASYLTGATIPVDGGRSRGLL